MHGLGRDPGARSQFPRLSHEEHTMSLKGLLFGLKENTRGALSMMPGSEQCLVHAKGCCYYHWIPRNGVKLYSEL